MTDFLPYPNDNNPTTAEHSISIVICAYTFDRWEELEKAISSIMRQTIAPKEIILVIDHNHELFEKAKETFVGCEVIENYEGRGLSGARNSGVKYSSGEIIAFMDEDAIADANWINNLITCFQDRQVVGVGGMVLPIWDTYKPDWLPEEFYWVVGCSYKGLPEMKSPIRNPIGCNMSFRREVLLSAGGFKNSMGRIGRTPIGCEETELSIRISQLNRDAMILYQPEAIVLHKVPGWRASMNYFIKRTYAEGLSKARVAQFVGKTDGLSSERQYVLRTLGKGIRTGVAQLVFQFNFGGLKQAGMIALGLFLTVAGYLVGSVSLDKGLVDEPGQVSPAQTR